MPDYPLVFTLTHDIRSQKFSARVTTRGRALMVIEDGKWWCHGVEPGGLTEQGEQPALTFVGFKVALGEILEDLAGDAGSFETFARMVHEFVEDCDTHEAQRWDAARLAIRSGSGVAAPFNELRREVGEIESWAKVERLEHIEAEKQEVALAEAA